MRKLQTVRELRMHKNWLLRDKSILLKKVAVSLQENRSSGENFLTMPNYGGEHLYPHVTSTSLLYKIVIVY